MACDSVSCTRLVAGCQAACCDRQRGELTCGDERPSVSGESVTLLPLLRTCPHCRHGNTTAAEIWDVAEPLRVVIGLRIITVMSVMTIADN